MKKLSSALTKKIKDIESSRDDTIYKSLKRTVCRLLNIVMSEKVLKTKIKLKGEVTDEKRVFFYASGYQ